MLRRVLLAFGLLALISCDDRGTEASLVDAPDASARSTPSIPPTPMAPVEPIEPDGASPNAVAALLRAPAEISQALRGARPLVRSAIGFTPAAPAADSRWRAVGTSLRENAGDAIEATLPASTGAPTHLALRGREDAWIEIVALDVNDRPGELADAGVVFRGGVEDGEIAHFVTATRIEELRLLRTPRAPHAARYALSHGPGIAGFRQRGGRVEALDRAGAVALATTEAFAIDAQTVRRNLALTLAVSRAGAVTEATTMTVSLDVAGLTFPIVVDPGWTAAAMPNEHAHHATAILASGEAVVTGGYASGAYSNAVSIYAPALAAWITPSASPSTPPITSMTVARSDHTATAFGNRVFVAGGATGAGAATTATEIYDRGANTWTVGPSLGWATRAHAAVRLTTGAILIQGGESEDPTADVGRRAQVYVPGGAVVPIPSSDVPHAHALLFALEGGDALVVGGKESAVTEIYDHAAQRWVHAGALNVARESPLGVKLKGGRVLVAGGTSGCCAIDEQYASAELWDPATRTWTLVHPMSRKRFAGALALLPSGHALAVGGLMSSTGDGGSDAEIYDPIADAWSAAGDGGSISAFTLDVLADGTVLAAGGDGSTYSAIRFAEGGGGESCWDDYQCASHHCSDGVCCDTRCNGSCSACNLPGSIGICAPVTGPVVGPHRSCLAFACSAGACRSSCTDSTECADGFYCAGSKCRAQKALAEACVANEECASGACVDGVCCDRACDGQCEACTIPSNPGRCTATVGAPVGARPACGGLTADAECASACNGVDRAGCHYPDTASTCGAAACWAGAELLPSTCDGKGGCTTATHACGAYACGATACRDRCDGPSDCAPGFACKSNTCTSSGGKHLGDSCIGTGDCPTGTFCTDGACCVVLTCGAGKSCSTPGRSGECASVRGAACTSHLECGSNFCVDGVCCDRGCWGQCEACNVPGRVGQCATVAGAPHSPRTSCSFDPAKPCEAHVCDGAEPTRCLGFIRSDAVGQPLVCAPAACVGANETTQSTCDGAGACVAGASIACTVGYRCDGATCRADCTKDSQCAYGSVCDHQACVASGHRCSRDRSTSVDARGVLTECAPYLCGAGVCGERCETNDDCARGAACDTASNACVGAGKRSGGPACALVAASDLARAVSGRATASPVALAALLGAALVRRRRRRVAASGRRIDDVARRARYGFRPRAAPTCTVSSKPPSAQ